MNDPADTRFFAALQQVLAQSNGTGYDACRVAVDQAIATGTPQALRAARLSIGALPAEQHDKIMAQVHARMAGDLSAIWNFMPLSPGSQEPN